MEITDERIIAYLLEELTEEESERFEDELFAADEWETDIQAVEDELMDAYLRGELSPDRRRRFEENFLSAEARRERFVLAAALLKRVDELSPDPVTKPVAEPSWWQKLAAVWSGRTPAFRFVAVFALLVLFLGTVWFVGFRGARSQTSVALSLNLTNPTRGESDRPERVNLQGKDVLRVTLALPETVSPNAKFQAELRGGVTQTVSLEPPTHEGASLIVEIPASQLHPGNYQIKISTVENNGPPQPIPGGYHFVVE